VAEAWATKNTTTPTEITSIAFGSTCSGESVPDTITVRLERPQTTFFATVLGISSATVNVCATARTGMARGGPGLLPIGLLYENPSVPDDVCYYNGNSDFWYDPTDGLNRSYAVGGVDEECIIKIKRPNNDNTWAPGATGPIRLDDPSSSVDPDNYDADCEFEDGAGGSGYGENIEEGSECSYARNDWIRPLPGAQVGQTCSSFDTLLDDHLTSDAPHAGHNINDVFKDPVVVNGDYLYTVVDSTNPHFGVVPIVTTPAGGASEDVQIMRFVTVYVVGCTDGGTGNGVNESKLVTIIPVNSVYIAAGQEIVEPGDPDYLSDWPAYTIKLTN
jgi:hypothetical protein